MTDFSAYLAAQHLTQNAAHEARPEAPVRPDRMLVAGGPGVAAARQWLSLTLRRLADVIQPVRERRQSALPAGR